MMPAFQNTLEWLQWRVLGIGSSDGPALMGKSNYKTKLELWDEKFNKIVKEEEPNFIQMKGHKLEVYVRGIMEFRTGYEWKPRLFTHAQYEWVRASMDGWNEIINEGWECKYMGKEMYLRLIDTTKSILERIPEEYLYQICHQFFVTNARAITLSGVCDSLEVDESGNKMKTVGHLRIPLTDELKKIIQEVYAPAMFAFWESIQKGERPEESKEDVVEISDESLGKLIANYAQVDGEIKRYTKIKDKHKDLIFNHASRTHSKMVYDGHQIMVVSGGKSVDYKAAFEAFCSWIHQLKTAALNFEIDQHTVWQSLTGFPDKPNLEPYTKVSADSFKILPAKEKKEKKNDDKLKFKEENAKPDTIHGTNTGPEITTMANGNNENDSKESKPENENSNSSAAVSNSPVVGHIPPKKVNDDPFDFVNPTNGRRPRGWDKQDTEWRIKYCKKEMKTAGIGLEAVKIFQDMIEKLEASLPPKEAPKTPQQIADEVLASEKIGTIEFSKG